MAMVARMGCSWAGYVATYRMAGKSDPKLAAASGKPKGDRVGRPSVKFSIGDLPHPKPQNARLVEPYYYISSDHTHLTNTVL